MTYTPGPWRVAGHRRPHSIGLHIRAKGGPVISGRLWGGVEKQLANARLIAAAPKLLAACEAVVDASSLEGEATHCQFCDTPLAMCKCVAADCRAAIAAAKGETP